MKGNPNKNLTFEFLSPKNPAKEKWAKPKHVWAVGGGKGGTGKTLITVNLGISLAKEGKEVLLIDADLGGANLHTCLGLSNPKKTLGDFLSRKVERINDILIETNVKNLSLINGSGDMLDVANLKYTQKMRFIRQFKRLPVDHLIMDLGAGTNFNILDFFINADMGILVLMPEPTSIENAYRFLKSVFYRKIKGSVPMPMVRKMIDDVISKKEKNTGKTPFELLQKIEAFDKNLYGKLMDMISKFRVKLILNQIRGQDDLKIGRSMARACRRYFGIEAEFLGGVHHDKTVWKSIQSRCPVTVMDPSSRPSIEILKLKDKLIDS